MKHSMRRIFLIFSALIISAIHFVACGGVAVNVQNNTTPIATAQIEIPTLVFPTLASGSVTRAPPTPRALTPTRPARVNGLQTIALAELPPQARETLALIERGGPFPYRQDGQIFQNREGILPKQARGYYHEYTVETPGEGDRGARRIVTGEQGELYYTDDHYESFKVIIEP